MFIIISPSILETLYNNIFRKFLFDLEKEWDTVEKMFNYYIQVKDSNQTPYIASLDSSRFGFRLNDRIVTVLLLTFIHTIKINLTS